MTSRWHASPGWVWRPLSDGGLFFVDTDGGDYLGVNRTAALFFELAVAGHPLDTIVERFAARFSVPRDQLTADLAAIGRDLERAGVLEKRGAEPASEEQNAPRA